jgi:hypothetical protein
VLGTLGAQAVSVALYLLGDEPLEARAWCSSYGDERSDDVACCLLTFVTGAEAHRHLSRLDPRPASMVTVVGSQRSAVFDELASDRRLTIYEPMGGAATPATSSARASRAASRYGSNASTSSRRSARRSQRGRHAPRGRGCRSAGGARRARGPCGGRDGGGRLEELAARVRAVLRRSGGT